jgi:putative membrane protein
MLALIEQTTLDEAPWKFQWHPEVWLLVISLTVAFVYMVKVIGPKAVPAGEPVITRKNRNAFIAAMLILWIASDWPLHDISEEYLYSAHMLQHMALSYFLPPLALLATPPWLLRVLIGNGQLYRGVKFLTRPVIAGVLFNLAIMITHIPGVVNASVESGPLHYSLHVLVVTLSLLMWMPVVGPFSELRLSPIGKTIYLFMQSLVPTVPAAWLTFADGAVYKVYDVPVRVFGWTVVEDQQLAGAIMKTGDSIFLWTIVIYIFFRRVANGYSDAHDYRRPAEPDLPESADGATADSPLDHVPLTTADVERAFARTPAKEPHGS